MSITPAARREMEQAGYRVVFQKFGPAASGKSREAAEFARRLQVSGQQVIVEDEVMQAGVAGVRVWAKRAQLTPHQRPRA